VGCCSVFQCGITGHDFIKWRGGVLPQLVRAGEKTLDVDRQFAQQKRVLGRAGFTPGKGGGEGMIMAPGLLLRQPAGKPVAETFR